jgi:hypothetical protein
MLTNSSPNNFVNGPVFSNNTQRSNLAFSEVTDG